MFRKLFTPRAPAARLGVGLVSFLALACLSGIAFAGSGGGVYVPQLGVTLPADKAAAVQHSLPRSGTESSGKAPVPAAAPDRIPAKLLGPDAPVPIAPSILHTTNAWLVSDGNTLVAVYAGSAGDNPANGRLVIIRQNLKAGVQTQDIVDAGATGALTIVGAPLGDAVETSAQLGQLKLRGANGALRRLLLGKDTVQTG
jgi:hypothetical protein